MPKYLCFGAMILTSTVVMVGLMYLDVYSLDHVYWSETRAYMALIMGAIMAIVMLGFMLGMCTNTKANLAIVLGSIVVFALTLYLVRSQATVEDVARMKAMIPHHSIATLTSEPIYRTHAFESSPTTSSAPSAEIGEMKALIQELEKAR